MRGAQQRSPLLGRSSRVHDFTAPGDPVPGSRVLESTPLRRRGASTKAALQVQGVPIFSTQPHGYERLRDLEKESALAWYGLTRTRGPQRRRQAAYPNVQSKEGICGGHAADRSVDRGRQRPRAFCSRLDNSIVEWLGQLATYSYIGVVARTCMIVPFAAVLANSIFS
jgi:hypothetical protein